MWDVSSFPQASEARAFPPASWLPCPSPAPSPLSSITLPYMTGPSSPILHPRCALSFASSSHSHL